MARSTFSLTVQVAPGMGLIPASISDGSVSTRRERPASQARASCALLPKAYNDRRSVVLFVDPLAVDGLDSAQSAVSDEQAHFAKSPDGRQRLLHAGKLGWGQAHLRWRRLRRRAIGSGCRVTRGIGRHGKAPADQLATSRSRRTARGLVGCRPLWRFALEPLMGSANTRKLLDASPVAASRRLQRSRCSVLNRRDEMRHGE